MDEKRGYIQKFSFDKCPRGNQGYKRLLIQLFGFTGHGKSSFINSCKYVVDEGDYQNYNNDDGESDQHGTHTMKRNPYPLTNTVTLVDNRGCVKMKRNEIGAIYTQLGNFQPLDTKVEWHTNYNDMLKQLLDADRRDSSADFIAPVFVYSANKTISDPEFNDLKVILTMAHKITKILPAVIITHETSKHLPEIQAKFRMMGVQLIFPIENYTQHKHLKVRRQHEKILNCLYEIIKDVEFRMKDKRNPTEEMIERKKILHTFLIDRERAEIKRKEAERREAERKEYERLLEIERNKSIFRKILDFFK